jgi:hypothetical protein
LHICPPTESLLRQIRECSGEEVSLEELMIEILMEENYLRRYEPIQLQNESVLFTEADLWLSGG